MDTLSDMQAGLQSDLNIGAESTLFDPNTLTLAINRAYRKISGMFKWPALHDALKTSTEANQEYYDYPDYWRPDSIWKVKVDGEDMGDALTTKDYFFEQEQNFPSGPRNIWTNQRLRIFLTVNGVPPLNDGDNNIELWGQMFPPKLNIAGDVSVFSYDMPEVNEAIVLEALSILRIKGGEQPVRLLRYVQGALLLSIEAQGIVQGAWQKILQEQAKLNKTTPMFNSPDFFRSGIQRADDIRNKIGNF